MNTKTAEASKIYILSGVIACFVLSGFAALLYQTAWMRQFSLVFGTSELAVAAVLAAYMGGLSLGASVAAKFVHRIKRPVLFYGVLEAGIAIAALAVPLMLQLASFAYVSLFGNQPEPVDASGLGQSFFYLLIAFLVLAIPTTFMGATLPLLTKYVVQSQDQIGSRVGLLYATNTAGAIAGVAVAGFVLLPILGLNGTVWAGVVINVLVFVLAALIARAIPIEQLASESTGNQAGDPVITNSVDVSATSWSRLWILPLMLISGANSFIYEVLWTRLLGHVLGGSITAFATMLAGFLSGIAIGSAIASRFARTRQQAVVGFVVVQAGVALTSILIYQLLPLAIPETAGLDGNILLAIAVLLPATIFIGATFPLAVRILALDETQAAASSARVYAWNTVGAIVGATLAAFFLIPALKYEGAVKFAVIINVLIALCAAAFFGRDLGARRNWALAGAGVFAALIFVLYNPKMPEDILRASPVYAQEGGEIRFYEVGRSATVLVIEQNGYMNLRSNGLPEASTNVRGAPPSRHNQLMLSTLPVLVRPETENMLVIGLGAGVALEGVPSSVQEVDVIELEPQVVAANQFFGDLRANDPLKDPRINVIINDARSAMTLTNKRYDVVVSQPSHPWTAGASHLYTREFIQLSKDRLTDDGVFLQWMNTQFIDELLLKGLAATMLDVFEHVRVYQWTPGVLFFLGSDAPMDAEIDMAATGRPIINSELEYFEKGVGSVEDLVAALALDQASLEAFAADGPIMTDNRNLMATRSARVMDRGETLNGNKVYDVIQPYDPLLQVDSWLRQDDGIPLNYSYVSRRLESLLQKNRAVDLANSLMAEGNPQALVMIGIGQQTQGDQNESQKNLLAALVADPENQQARYALLRPWLSDLLLQNPVPAYVHAEFEKIDGSSADTLRAWFAMSNNDLEAVARMDPELSQVQPSDLWYETSVKLRAEWRTRVTNSELQPRMAIEATHLIDSAISFFYDPSFYLMRMRSTVAAGDTVSAFATAARFMVFVDRDVKALQAGYQSTLERANTTRDTLRSRLAEVTRVLEFVDSDSEVGQDNVRALRDQVASLNAQLDLLQ